MYGDNNYFFGVVRVLLVRRGSDEKIPKDRNGKDRHTFETVYGEMLIQVCRDYPGIPDARTLKANEIRFFYEGLRAELKAHTGSK